MWVAQCFQSLGPSFSGCQNISYLLGTTCEDASMCRICWVFLLAMLMFQISWVLLELVAQFLDLGCSFCGRLHLSDLLGAPLVGTSMLRISWMLLVSMIACAWQCIQLKFRHEGKGMTNILYFCQFDVAKSFLAGFCKGHCRILKDFAGFCASRTPLTCTPFRCC